MRSPGLYSFSCSLVALALSTALTAAPRYATPEGCPDPDSHREELARGEVLIRVAERPGSNGKEGCAVVHIAASPREVFTVVRAVEHYAEFLPRVAVSEVEESAEGVRLNKQRIRLPFPLVDRNYTVRLEESPVGDEGWVLLWSYVEGSGNVKDTRGGWLVEAIESGSRVTYHVFTDPGGLIPKWAVNKLSLRTLPDVLRALADRVFLMRTKGGGVGSLSSLRSGSLDPVERSVKVQ